MDSGIKDVVLTAIVGVLIAGVISFGITVGFIMGQTNAHKERDIKIACINAGKQLIAGNCIPVP